MCFAYIQIFFTKYVNIYLNLDLSLKNTNDFPPVPNSSEASIHKLFTF